MRYITLFICVVAVLLVLAHLKEPNKPAPKPQKPVVIYRQVPAPRSQVDANLDYLARVAERQEFRNRWELTYGTRCPY